jgi:hypothetical protein
MKKLLVTSTLLALGLAAHADDTDAASTVDSKFFQASLTPDIAIHSRDTHIKGISLNIWGENPQGAFALGFVNGSTGDSSGFSLGLANYAENYTGVHMSFVNCTTGRFVGWQDSFVNYAKEFQGFQSGFLNIADSASGLQMGAVNYTREMNGVQIGFANIIADNPWFKKFPNKLAKGFVFVNWSF